jgi:hypothetical protein
MPATCASGFHAGSPAAAAAQQETRPAGWLRSSRGARLRGAGLLQRRLVLLRQLSMGIARLLTIAAAIECRAPASA